MPGQLETGSIGVGPASPPFRVGIALSSAVTSVAVAAAAAVTAAGAHALTGASPGGAVLQALARGLVVGVPLAVAFYACRRPSTARFGRRLLLASGLLSVAVLSTSSSPLLYSVGHVAGWLSEIAMVYALLTFPDGRLHTHVDRVVNAVFAAIVIALYIPTALFITAYPEPSSWSVCSHGCPHNVLMVARQPGWFASSFVPIRGLLTVASLVSVAAALAVRIRYANALMRRMLTPVLVVASTRFLLYVALLATRQYLPSSGLPEASAWMVALALPVLGGAFLLGLARWHLFVTAGVRTVNARLREMPGAEQVQELLAGAFEDPRLQIASWSRGRRCWIAVSGDPLGQPVPGSGRWLTEVRDGRRPVVAILHDAALRDDPAFIEAGAAAATVAFASDRVAARTAGMVRELRASRERIVAAADNERQRIERDLHDGAQQRFVGLCIHLGLAAEKAEDERPGEAAELRKLVDEVEEALAEMRSFTHGVFPATLLDHGLAAALHSLALRSPVPTTVKARGLGEYPREITRAVYFCCSEALQNVAKHATGTPSAHVVLREANSTLFFSVSDNGRGIAENDTRVGAGMLNMRDRMTTVGGQLTIRSRPGHGTRVSGRIPLAATVQTGVANHDGDPSRERTNLPPEHTEG